MNYNTFKEATIKLHQGDNTDYVKLVAQIEPNVWVKYTKKFISETKEKDPLYYMYTFTLKPGADPDKARQYLESTVNRKESLNIIDLAYSEEHINTNHHFHMLLGSTRNIRSDAFKQYTQSYGFVKRSRKVSDTNVQIVDYITKENTLKWLIKNKIVQ